MRLCVYFFFQAEDGIRDTSVTGVQTCALPISNGITPGTPTLVSKTASTITITWSAPTDAAGILGYRIYRDGGTTQIGSDIADLTNLTFTDSGLTAGQAYTYRVVGYVNGTPGVPLGAGTTESP